MLLNRVLG